MPISRAELSQTVSFVRDILTLDILPFLDDIEIQNPTIDLTPTNLKLDECISLLDQLSNGTFTSDFLPSFSYSEQLIGNKWIDGKPLYQVSLNFGALPNATLKTVAHGIANMENFWIDVSKSFVTSGGKAYALEHPANATSYWNASLSDSAVTIATASDRTAFSAFVTFVYTKTTDTV